MTVFEIQVNPERNALIRRALAKRIVRQREVEEEEASTEEDESFLGSSITIARKGSAASVSTTGSAGNQKHQRIKTDGGGRMNAKSRWKSEYLRTRSSSPSPSGSSFMSAISEILPPEMLPEILPVTMHTGNNSLGREKTDDQGTKTEGALPVETSSLEASDDGAATVSVTLNGAPLSSGDTAVSTDSTSAEKMAAKAEPEDTTPAAIAIEQAGPDPVEQDLLLKLEELRKEKSRLFTLFRNALQKKEENSKSPQPHPLSQSTSQEPESLLESRQEQDIKGGEETDPPVSRSVSSASAAATDRSSKDQMTEEGRQGGSGGTRTLGRLSDQNHERRPEPLSRQNIKRREYERVIDRSKLNLEIPRKPSISSASSNSTASTPTTSFAPLTKRGRSRSPSVEGGGTFNSNHRGSSGPGSFGPSLPSTSNSSSTSSQAESTSYPSKYPRADYMGPLQQQQQHNRNPSNSSNNGLPDKPQGGRYHTSSHFQPHTSSSARSLGGESYHTDEGGYSNRTKGSSSGPGSGMNGGSNGGSYRQSGPMNYHSQGPPPPTRIGFGDSGGNSSSSAGGRNSGSNGGGGGAGAGGGGRGGFYGHGHDGPPTAPISMLGPSGRTHIPFSRSMMQMPHSRGLAHGRIGFGHGSAGGRNAGGPPDRSMSSARPGDWSRRRSRAA
ncbi:hypothetical protein BGZ70_007005 [Mortierella alpina]|uniref:Uncharacterized protein n=1 Tax=Mortierella alpina TaxID=64518 RepID=A0A9P6J740_MORAP|nr:hypothetical protein BGZ70_007005 [Mortierella alpina]